MKAWFPERNKTYTIRGVGAIHEPAYAQTTLMLDGAPDLAADGIRAGDWFVIHFLQPGMTVSLPNVLTWRAP